MKAPLYVIKLFLGFFSMVFAPRVVQRCRNNIKNQSKSFIHQLNKGLRISFFLLNMNHKETNLCLKTWDKNRQATEGWLS